MKKLATIFLSLMISVSCAACSYGDNEGSPSSYQSTESLDQPVESDSNTYTVALITDSNGISDTQNMNAWQGVINYGDSTSTTYKYYQMNGEDLQSGLTAVENAINGGAEIVVFPSEEYKYLAYEAQYEYPDESFLLIGAMPTEQSSDDNTDTEKKTDEPNIEIADNVHCIYFKEEQAGYLAGYSAILEGNKTVAFIGDEENESNLRYAYGLVQGADDAMQELRVHDITVWYTFINPTEEKAKSTAASFYKDGADVIFTGSETITKGAAQSAKEKNKKIIYAGENNSDYSDVQLTSVNYRCDSAIELSLSSFFGSGGEWVEAASGKALRVGIENGCIALDTNEGAWNFATFTRTIYENTCDKFINGEVELSSDTENPPPIAKISYRYVEK